MFQALMKNLKNSAINDDFDLESFETRRTSERRQMDSCVGIIDGRAYPIKDWSKGGVLIMGDERQFALNETKAITIKFKLADKIIDVVHAGRVLRKGRDQFALQFAPLTGEVDRKFRQVVEDAVAQEFANSQA